MTWRFDAKMAIFYPKKANFQLHWSTPSNRENGYESSEPNDRTYVLLHIYNFRDAQIPGFRSATAFVTQGKKTDFSPWKSRNAVFHLKLAKICDQLTSLNG